MCSIKGERNRALRKPAPGIFPRTMAIAAVVPMNVEMTTVVETQLEVEPERSQKNGG